MVAKAPTVENAELYETDFAAWSERTAEAIRAGRWEEIDRESVAEEIEALARSDKREISSRLTVLIQHLLKWRYQPERRGASWLLTITEQRQEINGLIDDSPSLRSQPRQAFVKAYSNARVQAALAIGVPETAIPKIPPFTVEQALDPDFLPE